MQARGNQNLIVGTRIIWQCRTINNNNFSIHHQTLLEMGLPQYIEEQVVGFGGTFPVGPLIYLSSFMHVEVPIGDSRFLRRMARSLRPSGCSFVRVIESPFDEERMYENLGESKHIFYLSAGRQFEPDRMSADTPCHMRLIQPTCPTPSIDSPVRIGQMVQRLTASITFRHECITGATFTRNFDQLLPELETMLDLIYTSATTKPNPNWRCALWFTVPDLNHILPQLLRKVRQLGQIYNNRIVNSTPASVTIGGSWSVPTRTLMLEAESLFRLHVMVV